MPKVVTLDEFHILQVITSEVMRQRRADRIVDRVEISEEEYAQIKEYLGVPEGHHLPHPVLPPTNVYFLIKGKDGQLYNPVEQAKDRKVQIASAADEVFRR